MPSQAAALELNFDPSGTTRLCSSPAPGIARSPHLFQLVSLLPHLAMLNATSSLVDAWVHTCGCGYAVELCRNTVALLDLANHGNLMRSSSRCLTKTVCITSSFSACCPTGGLNAKLYCATMPVETQWCLSLQNLLHGTWLSRTPSAVITVNCAVS